MGILSACNEATKRPPAVTVLTATPFPTETPRVIDFDSNA